MIRKIKIEVKIQIHRSRKRLIDRKRELKGKEKRQLACKGIPKKNMHIITIPVGMKQLDEKDKEREEKI